MAQKVAEKTYEIYYGPTNLGPIQRIKVMWKLLHWNILSLDYNLIPYNAGFRGLFGLGGGVLLETKDPHIYMPDFFWIGNKQVFGVDEDKKPRHFREVSPTASFFWKVIFDHFYEKEMIAERESRSRD